MDRGRPCPAHKERGEGEGGRGCLRPAGSGCSSPPRRRSCRCQAPLQTSSAAQPGALPPPPPSSPSPRRSGGRSSPPRRGQWGRPRRQPRRGGERGAPPAPPPRRVPPPPPPESPFGPPPSLPTPRTGTPPRREGGLRSGGPFLSRPFPRGGLVACPSLRQPLRGERSPGLPRGGGGEAGPLLREGLPGPASPPRWKLPRRAGAAGSELLLRALSCALPNTSAAAFMNFLPPLRQVTHLHSTRWRCIGLPETCPSIPRWSISSPQKHKLWFCKTPGLAKSGTSQKVELPKKHQSSPRLGLAPPAH